MALEDVLSRVPGLAGYLAKQQYDQQANQSSLGQMLGVANFAEQQKRNAMQNELQAIQAQRQQQIAADEEALSQALPQLSQKYLTSETPDYRGFANALVGTRGGLQPGLKFLDAAESRDLRKSEGEANRIAMMDRLATQLDMRNQWAQMDDARKRELAAMMEQGRLDRMTFAAALRSASGGAGGDRLEPFKFNVGGRNVQGWRDKFGNVFDENRRSVSGIQPEVTAADQKASQERASVQQATQVLARQLDRMEQLVSESPMSVAGPFSPALNAGRYLGAQVGVTERPGREFSQLIEASLNEADKVGRLSNQQKNELRSLFGAGVLGDPDSVKKGIQLFRDYIGIRSAGTEAPVARPQPGAVSGQQSIDDLVKKWNK